MQVHETRTLSHKSGIVPIIFALFLIGGQTALAQQTVTSATLGGRVEDTSGAVVLGATLTVTNLDTNQKQVATTDLAAATDFPTFRLAAIVYQSKLRASLH